MREREEREHRDKERIHTINILDTDAIKRATVAIISFPASGFACKEIWCQQLEQFQLHQRNYHDSLTYKCQYSTKPHVRSLKISKTSYHLEISPLIPYQYEHKQHNNILPELHPHAQGRSRYHFPMHHFSSSSPVHGNVIQIQSLKINTNTLVQQHKIFLLW